MRRFLAMAVLGTTLAVSAGAAFASERVDYTPAFQPGQEQAIVSQTEPVQSVVAGVDAPQSVWGVAREDNREH